MLEILARDPWLIIPIVALMIPIVGIIVGGLVSIVKMIIVHRERMAMLQHGILPEQKPEDAYVDEDEDKEEYAAT